ncbi:MAG: tripartite tricarboxylate transporter substrate binding protein [Pseudomonadota bacterium]
MKAFIAAAMLAVGAAAVPALAQTSGPFPSRVVKIIVPQNPGGTSDVLARHVATRLAEKWGQPVVVDYKAGAGGNVGADFVAKSPADGYTLMLGYVGTQSVNAAVYKSLSYDPEKDFAAVAAIATIPFMTVVNNKLPVSNMKELIALAKTRSLNYATSGNGSLNHLMGEMLNNTAGVKIVHVPYKGIAQAVTDTIGGQIEVLHIAVPSVMTQVKAGMVKPIAVTGAKRVDAIKDVPTMAESGVKALEFDSWFGLFAPAAVPAAVVQKINADVNEILRAKDTIDKFAGVGADPLPVSAQAFDTMVKNDTARWGKVARDSGTKAD